MMNFVCACTESEFSLPLLVAIFLGLTSTRIADILSASGRSPLGSHERIALERCAAPGGECIPPLIAIFLGLTNPRIADILSTSGRSPLSLAQELLWKVCALRAGGQDVRDPF